MRIWKRPCLSEGRAAGNEEVDVKCEKGKRKREMREESKSEREREG